MYVVCAKDAPRGGGDIQRQIAAGEHALCQAFPNPPAARDKRIHGPGQGLHN